MTSSPLPRHRASYRRRCDYLRPAASALDGERSSSGGLAATLFQRHRIDHELLRRSTCRQPERLESEMLGRRRSGGSLGRSCCLRTAILERSSSGSALPPRPHQQPTFSVARTSPLDAKPARNALRGSGGVAHITGRTSGTGSTVVVTVGGGCQVYQPGRGSVSDQSADLHRRYVTVRWFVSVKFQADINDGASAEAGHTSDLRPHRLDGGSVSLGSKCSPNDGGAIEHPDVLMIDAAPALRSGDEPRVDAEQAVDLDVKARFLLDLPDNCCDGIFAMFDTSPRQRPGPSTIWFHRQRK